MGNQVWRWQLAIMLPAIAGCVSAAEPAARPDAALPQGIVPFAEPITLSYRGFSSFTYTFRSDIDAPSGPTIAEGWVMQGTMRAVGDQREWVYRMSNIGRDGVLREYGSLVVTTDAWGQVREARVTENRWSRGPMRSSADAYFDPTDLRFPLCCCPRGPVRLGEAVAMPPRTETMPRAERRSGAIGPAMGQFDDSGRSVAAGLLDRDGRPQLVLRHDGSASAPGPESVSMQRHGYSLIDTRACLPTRSVWSNDFTVTTPARTVSFSITHKHETRF
ncbi:hypothetical protein [Roseomonas sp. AR75]|uniref:hypothetical protein n=1 Tax=Roseomonas sp. AR75 TaxID=2562311 RepID=UPI0010C0618E|nr:hypothetical protein [Roseomonas sp. AR75]